jgi:hypothetical protein
MIPEDRRAFLKRLAQATAYVAPVIQSFAAPADLVGQGVSPTKKGGGHGGHGHHAAEFQPDPWSVPPPGQRP